MADNYGLSDIYIKSVQYEDSSDVKCNCYNGCPKCNPIVTDPERIKEMINEGSELIVIVYWKDEGETMELLTDLIGKTVNIGNEKVMIEEY